MKKKQKNIDQMRETYNHWTQEKHHPHHSKPIVGCEISPHRAKAWREQRNTYATAWSFTCWWMLYVTYHYEKRLELIRTMDDNNSKKNK